MSASSLGAPGTEFGPCIEACEHSDCAATRRMAGVVCPDCFEPIGYLVGFVRDEENEAKINDWDHLAHFTCYLSRVFDERRSERR